MKIVIQNARLAFAQHLFEAGTVGGEGEPAFSCTAIIPPDHPAVAELRKAEEVVAKEKFGDKANSELAAIRAKDKGVIHDGNTKANYDGFEGQMFVSTRSKTRPSIVDRDRSPLVAADGRPYSGCYANVIVEVWAQNNAYGKRINAQLMGVQFVKDGDSFGAGGRAADPDDFPDLSADEPAGAGLMD